LIGSSNYQDCIHGLGHGFVHYFGDDLDSSLASCHNLSFYQNILCVKGVMMQYTDNTLTRDGMSADVISNICNAGKLERNDYTECNMSTGTTFAFFTNHDFAKGEKLCDLIDDADAKNYCVEGLRLEIQDSKRYESASLTEDVREKFQPQIVEGTSEIIDIRSPAIISDFKYLPNVGVISFSIDAPQYVILYIPSDFVSQNMLVTVNGKIPNDLESQDYLLGQDMLMIRLIPSDAGTVLISPVS